MEWVFTILGWVQGFIHMILHMDAYLGAWVAAYGAWVYGLFFLVIFCETGLVVTPFLPGDSFLFALGSMAASAHSQLDIGILMALLMMAAILGDTVNYSLGSRLGDKLARRESTWWFKKEHLWKTQAFYEKHGGKTIIIARFMPIIRTFAPFVAGMGSMRYRRFIIYNILGGVAWVVSFLLAGYFFGNIPAVKERFHMVIIGIIVISLVPLVIEYLKSRRAAII